MFDLPKHHPKLGKVKEYEKSNSKNARNTKRQNLKTVKNDRSGLLVLKSGKISSFSIFCFLFQVHITLDIVFEFTTVTAPPPFLGLVGVYFESLL